MTIDCVLVHTPWQDTVHVHAKRCRLRVTDPCPVYLYPFHGRIKISREPLHRVAFHSNDGLEHGVASARDLVAARVGITETRRAIEPGSPQRRNEAGS